MKITKSPLRVKIWGVRGSLPAPWTPEFAEKHIRDLLNDFVEHLSGKKSSPNLLKNYLESLPRYRFGGFGGNTPCIEVKSEGQQFIIDGGSGIRPLGYELMKGPCGQGRGEVHLFFTHFHWDHVMGLPFFTPLFIPGNKIHVYSVQPDLPEIFQTVFRKPTFPVPLESLGSQIIYHRLAPRQPLQLGDMTITPYQLDHPDPCWGYKVECEGRVYSHCVDTECTRVSREDLGPDLPLYQGVNVMVFDAQYTLMESIEKQNWGHAAASLGLDLAMREGIERVVFMHHDPASSDAKIAEAENQAAKYYKSQLKAARRAKKPQPEVEWSFGFEGLVIDV